MTFKHWQLLEEKTVSVQNEYSVADKIHRGMLQITDLDPSFG